MLKNWGVSGHDPVFPNINEGPDNDPHKMQTNEFQIWEERPLDSSTRAPNGTTISKQIEILLDKDPQGEGFGFVLRGGAYCDVNGSLPLTVTKIIPGSPADREGTLQVGDRILEINGADMSQFTVQQAASILNEAENDVILLVEYEVPAIEWILNATGPVVVEIEKPAGKVLDITLSTSTWNGIIVVYIDSVYEAGIADRSGSLHVGDHVNQIDGIPVGGNVGKATSLIQSNSTNCIQLEIYPVSAQVQRVVNQVTSPLKEAKGSNDPPAYDNPALLDCEASLVNEEIIFSEELVNSTLTYYRPSVSNQGCCRFQPLPSYATRSLTTLRGLTPPLKMAPHRSATPPNSFQLRNFSPHSQNGIHHYPIRSSTPSNSGFTLRNTTPPALFRPKRVFSSSVGGLPGYGVAPTGAQAKVSAGARRFSKMSLNHVDVTEAFLFAGLEGFGIRIEVLNVEASFEMAVVTHVEPRGEADRSGVIQENDRVLAINGQSLKGKTTEDIDQLLASFTSGIIRFLIEFDVADSIVINSGTILVKLIRNGSSLGLSFTCPENRKVDDPLIISEIRKGSVAHRIGALCVGDALLSVDEADVINCSVEHVTKMLNKCGDIVRLTIRKNEANPALASSNLVIFSVELPLLTEGQLGIILSSSASSSSSAASNRIIVSTIKEGSIAHRTSALKAGDEVLSINGIPLDNRSLEDARRLLGDSTGSVCLKLKRHTKNIDARDHTGNKTQNSIDSAVESCDRSSTPNSDSANCSASSDHPPSSHPIVQQRQQQQQQQQQSRVCNEVTVTAEIHSSTDDASLPHETQRVEFPVTCSADQPTLPGSVTLPVPTTDDEWSCKLDELDKILVETQEPLSDSFSNLPQVDQNYVRNLSNMTSWVRLLSSDVIRDEKAAVDDNSGQTENKESRKEAGSGCGCDSLKAEQHKTGSEPLGKICGSNSALEIKDRVSSLLAITSTAVSDNQETGNDVCRLHEQPPEDVDQSALRGADQSKELSQLEELLESIFTPTPVELLRVMLYKVRFGDDFGFSLSDGVYEKGVYVSGIRPDSPASEALLPYDKILQINQIKTKDLDCHQVVPLIAQSGNCVELIVCRNALASSLPCDVSPSLRGSKGGSSGSSGSQVDQLWKPRCKRKVNFFPKNTVF